MSTFAYCVVQEEGWLFIIGLVGTVLVFLCLGCVFVVAFLRTLRSGNYANWGFHLKMGQNEIRMKGGAVALLVGATGLIVMAAVPYLGWVGYDRFGGKYAVDIDARSVTKSLEELRQFYQGDTVSVITLAVPVKQFRITGLIHGQCVADFFTNVCKIYSSQLTCESSFFSNSVSIQSK